MQTMGMLWTVGMLRTVMCLFKTYYGAGRCFDLVLLLIAVQWRHTGYRAAGCGQRQQNRSLQWCGWLMHGARDLLGMGSA